MKDIIDTDGTWPESGASPVIDGVEYVPMRDAKRLIAQAHAEGYAKAEAAIEALRSLKWKSVDGDNMEFACRITCYQMDKIKAALANIREGKEMTQAHAEGNEQAAKLIENNWPQAADFIRANIREGKP